MHSNCTEHMSEILIAEATSTEIVERFQNKTFNNHFCFSFAQTRGQTKSNFYTQPFLTQLKQIALKLAVMIEFLVFRCR